MDNELKHYGVLGQKWGVITKRESDLRTKAKNVVSTQKTLANKTKSDVKNAEWMSQSLPRKVAMTVLPVVLTAGVSYGMSKVSKIPFSKDQVTRSLIAITKTSVAFAAIKEYQGRSSLRRYDEQGSRNLSKKQYKSLTPETMVGIGVSGAMTAYSIYKSLGGQKLSSISKSKVDAGKKFVDEPWDERLGPKGETYQEWKIRMAGNGY